MTFHCKPVSVLLALCITAGFSGCGSPLLEVAAAPQLEEVSRTLEDADSMNSAIAAMPVSYAQQTVASVTPSLKSQILSKKSQNSDTVGWLVVPGTNINDVILQNPFEKYNNYYLSRNFYGQADKNGVFCADRRCVFGTGTRDELSTITTLYGHSWDENPDGELFSQLKRYKDQDFARTHPYIYFSTSGEDMVWEIFAIFETTVDFPYVWSELPGGYLQQVMDVIYKSSIYNYNTKISSSDKILTLSTCTYSVQGHENLPTNVENDYRFVIMARLVDPDERLKETVSFTVNSSPMAPDDQPHIELPFQYQ